MADRSRLRHRHRAAGWEATAGTVLLIANPSAAQALAQIVIVAHLLLAAFITAGLVAIPIGAALRAAFIYVFWWRALHVGAMTLVALQKALGRSCFLTTWESDLLARTGPHTPALNAFGDKIIYIDLPLWVFTVVYVILWVYTVWLWWRFAPKRSGARFSSPPQPILKPR